MAVMVPEGRPSAYRAFYPPVCLALVAVLKKAAGSALLLAVVLAAAQGAKADEFGDLMESGRKARQAGNFQAAAKRFKDAVILRPQNAEALFYFGLVQGYLGDYDAALTALDQGLVLEPENLDLLITRARVLRWADKLTQALEASDLALSKHPQSAEAHAVRGRLLYQQKRMDESEASFTRAVGLDPGNADAKKGLADITQARREASGQEATLWRLDLSHAISQFTRRNQTDWRETYLSISKKVGDLGLGFHAQRSERFGFTDLEVGARADYRFSKDMDVYADLSGTPDADFLPRWSTEAGGRVRVFDGWRFIGPSDVTAYYRHRSYADVDTGNVDPGLTQYFFGGLVWISGRWINSFDYNTGIRLTGWMARLDVQKAPFRFYAGVADAPESDQGVITSTRSRFGGVGLDLAPNFSLRFDYAREDRSNSYIRHIYSAGLTYKF